MLHRLSDQVGEGESVAALLRQLLRSVAACLATPLLLLAVLVVGCWLYVLGIKRPRDG
jgi:hypothetical protein